MDETALAKLRELDEKFPNLHHFNLAGRPIPFSEWARRFEDKNYQVIQQDERGNILVSTVWLGMDHGWGGPVPIIFETMIFGGPYDEYQERYATLDQAIAGHRAACKRAFSWHARLRSKFMRDRRKRRVRSLREILSGKIPNG